MHRHLKRYFLFLSGLSLIAFIPSAALTVLIITGMMLPLLGGPGFLIMAAPTILLYSITLVPLVDALTAETRRFAYIALAILLPLAVTFGPGLLSQKQVAKFAARMNVNDAIKSATTRPRSIELLGDLDSGLFLTGQRVGDDRASCSDICRRLLFNGEVDWVRMTRIQNIYMGRRPDDVRSVTYHLDHQKTCPLIYPEGTKIEPVIVDNRLVAGVCLVAEVGGDAPPEAVATWKTRYSDQDYPSGPPENDPSLGIVKTVKELQIEAREGGQLSLIRRQTETVADLIARPFYIGAEIHMQGGYNGPILGRDRAVMQPIDLAQTLRDTFGYRLAETSAL